ncbi:MAG: hypothetical protein LBH73_06160 [Spirochaetaceae bacterium]|nr:hypothetical protein [Spirochaetaceae bacterium]
MADPELVRVLDYILNRCNEKAIDAVGAAVVRRRRDLAMFGQANLPDPKRMAQSMTRQINAGASIDGLRKTIQDMAVRIIRQEAPELSDEQVEELTRAWIPSAEEGADDLPRDLLTTMISQFIAYSQGTMGEVEERELRNEMGDWPRRYWKVFPQVIRLIITDYLYGGLDEKEFKLKIGTALALEGKQEER